MVPLYARDVFQGFDRLFEVRSLVFSPDRGGEVRVLDVGAVRVLDPVLSVSVLLEKFEPFEGLEGLFGLDGGNAQRSRDFLGFEFEFLDLRQFENRVEVPVRDQRVGFVVEGEVGKRFLNFERRIVGQEAIDFLGAEGELLRQRQEGALGDLALTGKDRREGGVVDLQLLCEGPEGVLRIFVFTPDEFLLQISSEFFHDRRAYNNEPC
jgi:hypothetical protein